MNNNNFEATLGVGILIFISFIILAFGIRSGVARSGAMQAGMTPQQYSDWMDSVDNL